MPKKLLDSLPEVFVSNAELSSIVSRQTKQKKLRKLASKVYTQNFKDSAESIIRRNLWILIAQLFPGALISDRTAIENGPASDGSIFLISNKKSPMRLPGITVRPRKGQIALISDRNFIGGLKLASPARACLENMQPSRSRGNSIARTLNRAEMEDYLENLLQLRGEVELNRLRDEARQIAPLLNLQQEYKLLDKLIGALLQTQVTAVVSLRAKARVAGKPYDSTRMEMFEELRRVIERSAPIARISTVDRFNTVLPFFEAYFSNYIEGTEFEVDEAIDIIFHGKIPEKRPQDAHDILGTFNVVADNTLMSKPIKTVENFFESLKWCHQQIMGKRPDKQPGQFKKVPNRAGSTYFVAPELVVGTLEQGFEIQRSIMTPFGRAVFMMFLISEVHPFLDGNGRTGRIFMNMELVAAAEQRIIIPTVYRDDYISGLKAVSFNRRGETLLRILDFAQRYTNLVDWSNLERSRRILEVTNAFMDSSDAYKRNVLLKLPSADVLSKVDNLTS